MTEETRKMQSDLETFCSQNPEEILLRIAETMTIIARSGEMLAIAKRECSKSKRKEILDEVVKPLIQGINISATTQKAIIDSVCAEQQFIVDWLDRINRTATHQLEGFRSMLSYEKEHLRLTKIGG